MTQLSQALACASLVLAAQLPALAAVVYQPAIDSAEVELGAAGSARLSLSALSDDDAEANSEKIKRHASLSFSVSPDAFGSAMGTARSTAASLGVWLGFDVEPEIDIGMPADSCCGNFIGSEALASARSEGDASLFIETLTATAVPEPTSLALALAALGLIAVAGTFRLRACSGRTQPVSTQCGTCQH